MGVGLRTEREVHFSYASGREVQKANDGGATRQLEQETATDRDGRALREQVLAQQVEGAEYDPSVYKGMNNYKVRENACRRGRVWRTRLACEPCTPPLGRPSVRSEP